MSHRLPALDTLRIAAPCRESWDRMAGNERVRNCASCKLDVYNLSAMTRAEAEGLLASRTGRMCARYYQRADGTILTADCPVGVRRRRRQVLAIAAVGGAASLAALVGVARSLQPTPPGVPHVRLEIVEPAAALAEHEVQPEPQRVLRARPEMYIPPQAAIDEDHGHWLQGDVAIEPGDVFEDPGAR